MFLIRTFELGDMAADSMKEVKERNKEKKTSLDGCIPVGTVAFSGQILI
jgi:hypothetical protein